MHMPVQVILFEPEIPPNTGNIIRLCANTGARLHLIQPLGFALDDARLRRAGLDYHEFANIKVHASLAEFLELEHPDRVLAFSRRATRLYTEARYGPGDALLFGPETRGLPNEVLASVPAEHRLRLPMQPGNRSLNLSNAVAVAVFEAWRQQAFAGADITGAAAGFDETGTPYQGSGAD
ncbi:MAG: tRNA (cytidine(34)-2'-O)-methyltransferase [Acidiferrobacteraceae bacterium]